MSRRKLSPDKRDQVRSLLKCGLTGYEIAEKADVSVSTVTKIRKELQDEGFQIWHVKGGLISGAF